MKVSLTFTGGYAVFKAESENEYEQKLLSVLGGDYRSTVAAFVHRAPGYGDAPAALIVRLEPESNVAQEIPS